MKTKHSLITSIAYTIITYIHICIHNKITPKRRFFPTRLLVNTEILQMAQKQKCDTAYQYFKCAKPLDFSYRGLKSLEGAYIHITLHYVRIHLRWLWKLIWGGIHRYMSKCWLKSRKTNYSLYKFNAFIFSISKHIIYNNSFNKNIYCINVL